MQYIGWLRLRTRLRRWVQFVIAWQLLVLLFVGLYVAVLIRGSHSAAWIAPPVGLVVGTALPLQVVVFGLLRDLSR